MNVMMIFGLIIGSIVLFGAAGFGYWFWAKTRNKKVTYKAKIWERTGAHMADIVDTNEPDIEIDQKTLFSLKPYGTDTIVRQELGQGNVVYKLLRFNKALPEVKAEHIQYWGKDNKMVHVLKDGDNFTLLRLGLDSKLNMNFQPLPYDLANMLSNQYYIKKERLRKEKDVFSAITPWIVAMVVMIGMIGSAYLFAQAWEKSTSSLASATTKIADAQTKLSDDLIEVTRLIKSSGLSAVDIKSHLGFQNSTQVSVSPG